MEDIGLKEENVLTFKLRKGFYEKTISEKSEISLIEEESIDNNNLLEAKRETLTEPEKILDILRLVKRENVFFKIEGNEKEFSTQITSLKPNEIFIINSFSLYGEIKFPEKVNCSFEIDGIEYSFLITFKENFSDEIVKCTIPKQINIFKRRSSYRVKVEDRLVASVYWPSKEKEFLGLIQDISLIGVGLKFDYDIFDMELFTSLNSNKDEKLVIMFEFDKWFYCLNIESKHIKIDEKTHSIELGAEFIFPHADKMEVVERFVEKLKSVYLRNKKVKNSLLLIETSKNGTLLND